MKGILTITLLVIGFGSIAQITNEQKKDVFVLSDQQVQQLITYDITDQWYSIYFLDGENEYKCGYIHYNYSIDSNFQNKNTPVLIEKSYSLFQFKNEGIIDTSSIIKSSTIYQLIPPYDLLYQYSSESEGDSSITYTSNKEGNTMTTIKSDGVNKDTTVISDFDYRLNQYLANCIFYLDSNINKIKSLSFEDGEFTIDTIIYKGKTNQVIDGVSRTFTTLGYTYDSQEVLNTLFTCEGDRAPITYTFDYTLDIMLDENFITNKMMLNEFMECRLVNEDQAKDTSNIKDFNNEGTMPSNSIFDIQVDQNYFDEQKLTNKETSNICFEINGDYNIDFCNSAFQRVFTDSGKIFLGLGWEYGQLEKASENEIKKSLEETDFYPIYDSLIVNMAKKAKLGAANDSIAIQMLLEFVFKYIDYTKEIGDYTTVYDIINNKNGDCSEYSFLFNVLARSIKIPSRQVVGYAYDPESNSFGLHAWNEVVIDGIWRPVDPTWNMWLPSFYHIKLNGQTLEDFPKFNLSLKSIEYQNSILQKFIENGTAISFYFTGDVFSEINYKNWKRDGKCIWYKHDGQKFHELNYSKGLFHGNQKKWGFNGQLIHEENFKNELIYVHNSYLFK